MRKRIALFGGTFDPPHFGHLNLAIEVKERKELDEVIWIPALCSPLKQPSLYASPSDRMEMVKRSIDDVEGFTVSDCELKRPSPSYTIDTLRELMVEEADYSLILSDEAYASFSSWRDHQKIEELVALIVVKREKKGVEIPLMEISATRIRDRLKKGLYCGHLVPRKVLDYIDENQLYSTR